MDYKFIPMNREIATRIVDTWKYEKEFSIYDYCNEADHMLDAEGWGRGTFAVLNLEGDLIGELSIEFFDEKGEPAEYRDFGNTELINQRELWIGFGMRPDLVGGGRGMGFVTACAEYAVQHCGYHGEFVRLGVAKFNQRAIKAYQKAGFEIYAETSGEISGRKLECVHMRKKLT
jgi:ribosomal-protein-alanine N-acetyltransferase